MIEEKLLGKGNTAEVFEYGEGKVCKLFFEGYPREYVELEYRNAQEMYQLKLSVPKPFEIVTVENRIGIIYERIDGETLLSRMYERKEECGAMMAMFVQLHRKLLEHHSRSVLPYKDFLIAMVRGKGIDNPTLIDEINSLPDDDCILHGDFHPGNVLVKSDGTPVIIDFMNVCHGPALYDVARTFFLFNQNNEELAHRYLKEMNVVEKDITGYLTVIKKCRQYEG